MKKVMFIQNEGNVVGGVWYVNKTVASALLKKGYEVEILSLRNANVKKLSIDNVKCTIINDKKSWDLIRKRDVILPLKRFNIFKFIKNGIGYINKKILMKKDYNKTKKYIRKSKPNYIIASQYQVLYGIPDEYLSKTVYEHHSSFENFDIYKDNYKVLKRFNNKIFGFVWLSKAALEKAKKEGFKNNFCIYNPVRFNTKEKADVSLNKKLVVISRIENYQKRINLMVKIVDQIFKENDLSDWTFDIYGVGNFDLESESIIKNNDQIIYKGKTDNPKNVLLKASINLNTSLFEGFSLSILEALMCGIPTVTFNHGEAAYEEVLNGKTGFIIEDDNISEFKDKLLLLMKDNKMLEDFSRNCKEYSNKFLIDNIVNEWTNLFAKIDKERL